jgi:hypothetical protein
MVIWAGASAAYALLLGTAARAPVLLRALAVMWRPFVPLGAAVYLLFFNGQGRELGVSLMDEKNGFRAFFLFLALIFWATNNWHTARLGIDAALRSGVLAAKGDEPWLYWPRFVGVCTHFFAAINLSLAAWGLPLAAWGESDMLRWLAWTAPLAVLLAAALVVWAEHAKRSSLGISAASPIKAKMAHWVGWAAICGELLLLVSLVGVFFFVRGVPEGFLFGTLSIGLSAVAFLVFITLQKWPLGHEASLERRAEDRWRQQKHIAIFTYGLFLIAFGVFMVVWTIGPTTVGQLYGSMVVTYIAFGATLATINAFELAVVRVCEMTIPKRPRIVGAYVVTYVIGVAILNGWLYPKHSVRLCDGGDCVAELTPDDRPTVGQAALAWYEQAEAAYAVHGDEPVPMFIVAAAGGGIRAAYWTATILERLEKDFEAEGGVRPYLFAISGVSGGSVGAAAFEAALVQRDESDCKVDEVACLGATEFLTKDFLAPALASLTFVDIPSSILPNFGQPDRGTAFEVSLEHASGGLLARPFLSFFRYKKGAVRNEEQTFRWRPILLLNATHEETGKRIIAAHVLIERDVFLDSLDELHLLGKDVRASTAAHNSARFTYVSPAGDLGKDSLGNNNGSVIDGGYFENSGALSALELARAARVALKDKKPGVKLVFLMISSDPSLVGARMPRQIGTEHGRCLISITERESKTEREVAAANYLPLHEEDGETGNGETGNALVNEFLAPLRGLMSVREAHENLIVAELALDICAENQFLGHLTMCKDHNSGESAPIQAPLGWAISEATRDAFKQLLEKNCGNKHELDRLEIALGKQGPGRTRPVAPHAR